MGMNNTNGAAQTAAPDSTASSEVNWASDFDVDFDGAGAYVAEPVEPPSVQVSEPSPSTAPAQQTAPVTQPATTAPAPSPTSEPTQVASPKPTAPTSTTTPAATPTETPSAPVDPAELLRQYQAELVNEYALSEDDALALATNPGEVMPKLASQMHMRIMQDVQRHVAAMMQSIPAMMQQHADSVRAELEAKQEFFGEWPGLSSHYDKVRDTAMMIRKANPTATKEQIMQMTGTMVAMSLGLDPQAVRKAVQQQQQAAVQRPAAMRPVTTVPTQVPPVQGTGNQWSDFAEEDINWMRGM